MIPLSKVTNNGILSTFYRKLLAKRYNLLIGSDSRVLEVGCREGDLLALINSNHKVGIDLSDDNISRGKGETPGLGSAGSRR